MNKLNEMLKQEKMEKGMGEIIDHIQSGSEGADMLMKAKLVGCSEKEHTVTIEFPVMEWQLNPFDKMHGGLIATAFDEALGILAIYLNNGKPAVSVSMSLNYLKPVPMNDSILITAKATSLGKKLITVSGECRLKSSGLLTGTAIETFATIG